MNIEANVNMRRRRMTTGLGLGAVLAAGSYSVLNSKPQLFWRDRALQAFGTTVWLRAGHDDLSALNAGLDSAIAALQHVQAQMSLFDTSSAVSVLNRTGLLRDPDPHLVAVLALAQQVALRSNGAFDVTVQPLWELWHSATQQKRLPSQAELLRARQLVNWQHLSVSPDSIRLAVPGMGITLNGIAQGYAADLARDQLAAHGVEHALLDTGEWASLGASPIGTPWALGVADPHRDQAVVANLVLAASNSARSVATSADNNTPFTADHRFHHVFDPATGSSPPDISQVTVLAPSCALADALTKVFFVNCKRGAGFNEQTAVLATEWAVDVLLIDKQGVVFTTPGIKV